MELFETSIFKKFIHVAFCALRLMKLIRQYIIRRVVKRLIFIFKNIFVALYIMGFEYILGGRRNRHAGFAKYLFFERYHS